MYVLSVIVSFMKLTVVVVREHALEGVRGQQWHTCCATMECQCLPVFFTRKFVFVDEVIKISMLKIVMRNVLLLESM